MDGGQGEGPGRQRGEEEQKDLSPSRRLNSAGIGPQDKVERDTDLCQGAFGDQAGSRVSNMGVGE